FYYTGLSCEDYRVAISVTDKGTEIRLFIEKPNYDIEKWVGRKLTKEQAMEISGIKVVDYTENFNTWLNGQIQNGKIDRLMLDIARYRWDDRIRLEEEFAHTVQQKYPQVLIGSISTKIAEMRVIKDKHEIEQMRKAIEITNIGIRRLYEVCEPGMMEYELEAEFLYQLKKRGEKNSFETIAASGENGVILHYVTNDNVMKDGTLVLMDLGSEYKEYAADISRTFPVNGKFTKRQRELYEIVLKAQEDVLEIMKPGTMFSELNKRCRESFLKNLKKIGLAKTDEELWKYYYHGVGHYLGLDVHDVGARDIELKEGMVITLEPGLYVAEEGIGIRIEDDILITKNGNENLSIDIPKLPDEIEKIMAEAKKKRGSTKTKCKK
ncbi:MAG: aminopeptidase P family protein, partial [Bacillota bacterium]|nr:aminopeptidase P family protein [Bacillota bacterium]